MLPPRKYVPLTMNEDEMNRNERKTRLCMVNIKTVLIVCDWVDASNAHYLNDPSVLSLVEQICVCAVADRSMFNLQCCYCLLDIWSSNHKRQNRLMHRKENKSSTPRVIDSTILAVSCSCLESKRRVFCLDMTSQGPSSRLKIYSNLWTDQDDDAVVVSSLCHQPKGSTVEIIFSINLLKIQCSTFRSIMSLPIILPLRTYASSIDIDRLILWKRNCIYWFLIVVFETQPVMRLLKIKPITIDQQ